MKAVSGFKYDMSTDYNTMIDDVCIGKVDAVNQSPQCIQNSRHSRPHSKIV